MIDQIISFVIGALVGGFVTVFTLCLVAVSKDRSLAQPLDKGKENE